MKLYIGTSGWSYSWNPDGLTWYVKHSGFNSIELNMSFYSFPRMKQVERWAKEGGDLAWVIKVHRSITHYGKLSEKTLAIWDKFKNIFNVLENKIHFYLFQLPPNLRFSSEVWRRIGLFASKGKIRDKMAIEPRHKSWFTKDVIELFQKEGLVFVTPDSPMFEGLPEIGVVCINGKVYVRMHGRLTWYNYGYLKEELEEVVKSIMDARPGSAYVFFNNNHDMLNNGREMKKIFEKFVKKG